ncbi:MAG: uncharacterized protein PWP23_531 [Candidatus Sumerlaeota bacterium]|nr:uncharacterized protein [Candidatus Sumerlaeota bacterium]
MPPVLTFLLVVAALGHIWLQLFNRVLLEMDDGPRKKTWQDISLALIVGLPTALLLIFWGSEPVSNALRWTPITTSSRTIFAVFGLLWLIGLWRGWLWACDRAVPQRSRHLLRQSIVIPSIPKPGRRVPFLLRPLETTYDLEVVERDIEVPGLAAEFDGLTIAQVSDLHYDPRFGQRPVYERIAQLVMHRRADIVVFTGDFINHPRLIKRSVAYHAQMKGELATLCVLGNHDYWTDPATIRDECQRRGIRLMGGERWVLERAGRRLIFAGTDAPWDRKRPDWRYLLEHKTGDAVILLSHTPDNAPKAARLGASLILSGHNHGGQYCLPFIGPVVVPSRLGHRYVQGVFDLPPDGVLCVSRGLGTSDSGNYRGGGRLLCPPELVFLTLRAPGAEVAVRVREKAPRMAAVAPTMPG